MAAIENQLIPLVGCVSHPENYNQHSPEQIADLALSLRTFGQVRSIVVQAQAKEHFTVVAGHGIVAAARAEGWAELRADVLPATWPAARVLAYLAADNELARRADPDKMQLARIVASLRDVDAELARLAAGGEARLNALLDTLKDQGSEGDGPTLVHTPLIDRFLVPPFTLLDARQGYWRTRRQDWLSLGIQSELGRDAGLWQSNILAAYTDGKGIAAGPSIFDPVLCEVLTRWFCPPAGLVLDPFAGGSVRGVVAVLTGRRYIGIDLRYEQVAANQEQWRHIARKQRAMWGPSTDQTALATSLAELAENLRPVEAGDLSQFGPYYAAYAGSRDRSDQLPGLSALVDCFWTIMLGCLLLVRRQLFREQPWFYLVLPPMSYSGDIAAEKTILETCRLYGVSAYLAPEDIAVYDYSEEDLEPTPPVIDADSPYQVSVLVRQAGLVTAQAAETPAPLLRQLRVAREIQIAEWQMATPGRPANLRSLLPAEEALAEENGEFEPVAESGKLPVMEGEDNTPELTPIEWREPYWFKRDDLYCIAGVRGAKARAAWAMAVGAPGVVTAGGRLSPQVNIVAHICQRLGIPCQGHTPTGELSPELKAAQACGMEIIQHKMGFTSVIFARARAEAERLGWVHIPFGMQCREAVEQIRQQVRAIPPNVRRIVIAVGSGICVSGVLWGLVDAEATIPVVGVQVGGDVEKTLDQFAPPDWRSHLTLVKSAQAYHAPAPVCELNGIPLDPHYEAKCLPFLQPGDLFWLVGLRETYIEARPVRRREPIAAAPLTAPSVVLAQPPQWLAGDARDVLELVDVDVDLLFTCPPYYDLEKYSNDAADLANAPTYKVFLEEYRAIIQAACERLAQNRFACIVVGDIRDQAGLYRGFVGDTIEAFQEAGLQLYNEAIFVTPAGSLPMRTSAQFPQTRKLGKTHQNVLVFIKGDPQAAIAACGGIEIPTLAEVQGLGGKQKLALIEEGL